MADVIPHEAIVKLIEAYGGQNLYIPSKPSSNSHVTATIGIKNMQALCAYYPGGEVVIPRFHKLRLRFRDREIIAGHKRGMRNHELASQFDLTVRQIQNILSGEDDE